MTKCKHNVGFRLWTAQEIPIESVFEGYPALWFCLSGCGYSLPFNPETYPEGVAYTQTSQGPGFVHKLSEGGKY